MNCGFSALLACGMPNWDQQRIFGTWDFKWPLSKKKITVAFQQLPAEITDVTLDTLIDKVESLANTWLGPACPFEFDFLRKTTLPAPQPNANGGRSNVARNDPYVEYDELVSFAPLPISFSYDLKATPPPNSKDLFEMRHVGNLSITLQTAQLGRFARRSDYGTPTVYLGQPRRTVQPSVDSLMAAVFPNGAPKGTAGGAAPPVLAKLGASAAEYFVPTGTSLTKEFEEAVVHEFGHVLGIPHLHQSPLINPSWKSIDAIEAILQVGIGVTLDAAFVQTQITLPLPGTSQGPRGSGTARCGAMFSDWPDQPALDPDGNPVDSVMTHPFQNALLIPSRLPLLNRFLEPQPADLDFLKRMYGAPRPPAWT